MEEPDILNIESHNFKELIKALGGIVWDQEAASGKLNFINDTVETLLGYSLKEFQEDPLLWHQHLHADDRIKIERLSTTAKEESRTVSLLCRRRRRDGKYIWLKEIVNIAFKGERPERLLGLSVDATEQVAERVQHQLILDSVPAMVWLKDCENNIIHANKAAAETINKTPEELCGRATRDLFPLEAESFYQDDLEVIRKGMPKYGIIEPITVASGERRWARTDKVPYRTADGEIKGVIVFAVDVTEEKVAHDELRQAREEAESSLKESEARLRNISLHMPGVVYQFLMRTDRSFCFPYVSESAIALLEYSPSELNLDPELAFSRIHPDDLPALNESIEHSLKTLDLFQFEGRFYTRSGKLKWINASSTAELLENGDILFNGLVMDISVVKEAQEKIRILNEDLGQRVVILGAVNKELELLTHKLESSYDQALQASKLKSEFVANISHEIRTPISAVIGMAELLLDSQLTDEQRQFAKIVRESGESLLTIINDILDFSKIEAGKIELESIEFDIRSIMDGCMELLSSSARQKGLSIMTFADPSIPYMVRGDPIRLRQVLLNLTSNAVKFTEDGEVVLRALKMTEREGYITIRFEVSDTGIGLSEEARKLLFQPFVQADGSTTRRYGGTGLGLSICKRLVELMGGKIDVESVYGGGSTFWFTVPFLIHAEEQAQPVDVSRTIDIKVLVVDQAPASRLILENYLSAAMIECDCSVSQEEALLLLRQALDHDQPFSAIIVNSSNETIDTFEFAQIILSEERLAETKLILLTPFDEREKSERARKLGFSACITKPVRQTQLVETLMRVCEEGSSRRQAAIGIEGDMASEPQGDDALLPVSGSDTYASEGDERCDQPVCDKPVLLAEDNPLMQELAMRQLSKLGIAACVVSNGREAIEAAERNQYSLILMDCQMPEIDGFEATRAIRRGESLTGAHIPIIAMTASAMRGDRDHCIAAGMDDYLSKPVGQTQLKQLIERWLGRRVPAGEHGTDGERGTDGEHGTDGERGTGEATGTRGTTGTGGAIGAGGTAGTGGAAGTGEANGTREASHAGSTARPGNKAGEASKGRPSPGPEEGLSAPQHSPIAASSGAPLDITRLEELYGAQDLNELLFSFIQEGRNILTSMHRCLADRDVKELAMQAHQLKGLAAIMTADEVQKISLEIETAARQASWERAGAALVSVQAEFETVTNFINSVLPEKLD